MTVSTPELQLPASLEAVFPRPLRQRLLALRWDLHRHPELSFREERTAGKLTEELASLEPRELTRIAGTGVVARLAGEDPSAPAVAIRGDIDALPIEEATGLDGASVRPGVMHACGHDVHATWAVGAAHLLRLRPARGDALIVLQPAEEIAEGALAVLASGALDRAAAIFGGHVDTRFEIGQVVADSGPLAASSDAFEVRLRGGGAHGARPQEAPDPVVATAALVQALQTIVSRRLHPAVPAVVTVGVLEAGRAPNVIPATARLAGTLRAVDPETRAFLQEEIRRVARGVAELHGLAVEVEIHRGTPPILNPVEATEWARRAVVSVLGEAALVPLGTPNLGGEDFAYYLERMPGCFLRVGARRAGAPVLSAHSPGFFAADESMFVGAAVLAEAARQASRAFAGA